MQITCRTRAYKVLTPASDATVVFLTEVLFCLETPGMRIG